MPEWVERIWVCGVVVDVKGEEKKNLTVEDLLSLFNKASGEEFSNDRAILS